MFFNVTTTRKNGISCLFKNKDAKYAVDGSSVGGCKMCSEKYFLCDLISSFLKNQNCLRHVVLKYNKFSTYILIESQTCRQVEQLFWARSSCYPSTEMCFVI